MSATRILLFFISISLMPVLPGFGQSGRPTIIRDTDIAEGIVEDEALIPKEPNPDEAKENINVGNFYYKRKNYVGAILRYLTAIEYQPDSEKAYESLVKAYESIVKAYESKDRTQEALNEAEMKYGEISLAINAFTHFLRVYTDSIRSDDIKDMKEKLEEVSSRFDNL